MHRTYHRSAISLPGLVNRGVEDEEQRVSFLVVLYSLSLLFLRLGGTVVGGNSLRQFVNSSVFCALGCRLLTFDSPSASSVARLAAPISRSICAICGSSSAKS